MAQDPSGKRGGKQAADLNVCFFPYLKEFIVLDTRADMPGGPTVRPMHADDVYDDRFYRALQEDFADLLRDRDQPFATLMALSTNVERVMRERGMQALLEAVGRVVPIGESPTVAIVVFAGPLLNADDDQLRGLLRRLLPDSELQPLIAQAMEAVRPLIARQRQEDERLQRERTHRSLLRGDEGFFTLWQRPPEESGS